MRPTIEAMATTGVLFVCLGNICRSPLARMLFEHHAAQRGLMGHFLVDSCGTGGWHAGGPADPRSVAVAREHGLVLEHVARQLLVPSDFSRFEHLIVMDANNKRTLIRRGADAKRVRLIREFLDGELDVPDPYEGSRENFEHVYSLLDGACAGLLDGLAATRTKGLT